MTVPNDGTDDPGHKYSGFPSFPLKRVTQKDRQNAMPACTLRRGLQCRLRRGDEPIVSEETWAGDRSRPQKRGHAFGQLRSETIGNGR